MGMSPNLPIYDVAVLKQALQMLKLSREQLESNFREMQRLANEINDTQQKPEDTPVPQTGELEELRRKVVSLLTQLKEKDERLVELTNDRNELVRKVEKAAFDGPRNIYHVLGLDREYPIDKMRNRIAELEGGIERIQRQNQDLGRQLIESDHANKDLKGSYERTRQEKELLSNQLKVAAPEARENLLADMIVKIGANRLGRILCDDIRSEDFEKEKIKLADRILEYLQTSLELQVSHPIGFQEKVTSEDIINVYDLDEPFEDGCLYEVKAPGFQLKGKLIVRPKIQRQGDNDHVDS